jgi:hypothetical protein
MASDITLGGRSIFLEMVVVYNTFGMVIKFCGYEVVLFLLNITAGILTIF